MQNNEHFPENRLMQFQKIDYLIYIKTAYYAYIHVILFFIAVSCGYYLLYLRTSNELTFFTVQGLT